MLRLPLLLSLLLWLGTALGGTLASYEFDDPADKEAFRALIEEIRCLVCQNESLAGSNAELAQDLRQEIYDMFRAGKGKEEIVTFLVDRYGDFVLFRPPLKPSTYPLWFGPIILLVVATFFLFRALRKKKVSPEAELSAEEEARLAKMLETEPQGRQETDK
jgi:cytochrome c-type biogenesis protein CcmH